MEERRGIPHHLIDIVEPEHDYSVGEFYDDAKLAIEKITKKGKLPIIVGGTGLYFRILLENYDLPRIKANDELRNELNQYTNEELYDKLKELDAKTHSSLNPKDRVRLIRAIEVCLVAGKPFSELAKKKEQEYDVEWITPQINSRQELNERINKRVDIMVEMGLIQETEHLLKKHGRIKNITNTIGYREIIDYLDNKCSINDSIEKIKLNSRHYAKRQLTWFRRNELLNICY